MKKAKHKLEEVSPFRLLQEIYHPDTWKILVCTIMLNQTTGTQVHAVIKEMFRRWPNAKAMANADKRELQRLIKPCGLWKVRSERLIRFSQEFIWKDWVEPKELYGIGQYAQHSFEIFVKGLKIRPQDKELKKYVQWKYNKRRGTKS